LRAADIAPLYLHADPARRDAIRAGIAGIASLRGSASLVARPDPACCVRLVERAGDRNAERFGAELAASLGLAAAPAWRFEEPSRHELLALAILALGLSEEDGIRIFLTLHPAIACSVRTVFHLVHLLRTTPRTSAIHLVEAVLGLGTKLRPAGRHAPYLGPTAARAPAQPTLSDRRALPDRARRAG
jgi:hypothetical protein